MTPDPVRPWLFGECLSLDLRPDQLAPLRARLFVPGVLRDLTAFAGEEMLLSVLAERLLENVLVPPSSPGRPGPADTLQQYLSSHHARREEMAQLLREIVSVLNGQGIEPILLKGAQSLWTGQPAWRYMRDIDLLVPSDAAHAAQKALVAEGYHPDPDLPHRPHRHHLTPLYNARLSGWMEIHRRGGNRYAERLLPTEELARATTVSSDGGLSVGLLDPAIHLLHALIHHHIGHSAFARGTISLKGLYEFAWAAGELTDDQRHTLVARASAHPWLAAVLDLWVAAAAMLYSMPVCAPFAVRKDAAEQARTALSVRSEATWKYPGYGEEIRLAWAVERLRRVDGGGNLVRRQMLRARVIASMLPKIRRF